MFLHLAQLLIAKPKSSLLLAVALMGFFAWSGHTVRLNNQFAVLFAVDNESNEYRHFYRGDFGADDGILLAAMELHKPVDAEFLYRLKRVSEALSEHPDFLSVYSVATVSVSRQVDQVLYLDPLLDSWSELTLEPLDAQSLQAILALWRQSPTTAGRLISTDDNVFVIMAQMPNDFDRFKKIQAPAQFFQDTLEQHFFAETKVDELDIHYGGIAFTRIGILRLMHGDLFLLVPLTAIVLAVLTFMLYRNAKVVLIKSIIMTFYTLLVTCF